MRKSLVSLGLAFALMALTVSLMRPFPAHALAATAATSQTLPIHFIRSHDCTGEQVEFSGGLHLVSQVQANGTVMGHFNYLDVTGTGLTSGLTYRATALDHFLLSVTFPADLTSIRSFHLVGPGNNLLVHITEHVTVNANGEVIVAIDNISMECRG